MYREVIDAVLRAEASCAQALSSDIAGPEHPQAEFKLYTQDDADADMAADGDVGYSSDWDSDEDDDDDDEDDEDGMLVDEANPEDSNAPTYGALVALDSDANTDITATRLSRTKPQPRLPPLSSIRVYALEAVPEQTARNGVPFMGRGTPVDRQRRADWAAPARPCLPYSRLPYLQQQAHTQVWSPSPPSEFYSPVYQQGAGVEMGYEHERGMQVDAPMPMPMQVQMPVPTLSPAFGMGMSMEHPFTQQQQQPPQQPQEECLSWLDPALRAESMSPSPSPAPATPYVVQDYPAPTPSPDPSISALSSLSSFSDVSLSSSCSSASSMSSLGSPSPTGCAWHATFLQCLQSPAGCAPFFASCPPSPPPASPGHIAVAVPVAASSLDTVPVPVSASVSEMDAYVSAPVPAFAPTNAPVLVEPAPVAAGVDMGVGVGTVGTGMFPNQELAQFVRSHLIPGSVTLGHALG